MFLFELFLLEYAEVKLQRGGLAHHIRMAYSIRILHLHRVSCSIVSVVRKMATTKCTEQALSFTCPTIRFSHMAQNNPKTFKIAEQPNVMRLSQANEKISFTDHSIYN